MRALRLGCPTDLRLFGCGTGFGTTVPLPVAGELAFTPISVGGSVACGLVSGGQAYCWGSNREGTLGDGSIAEVMRRPQVELPQPEPSLPSQAHRGRSTTSAPAGPGDPGP